MRADQLLVDRGQRFLRTGVEELAVVGQRQAARGPVQQPGAEALLKLADVARHRGLGYPDRVGGADEAAGLDHGDEAGHFLEFVHGAPQLARYTRQSVHPNPVYPVNGGQ